MLKSLTSASVSTFREKSLRIKTVIGRERTESCGCDVVVVNHPDEKAEISPNIFAIVII